MSHSIEVDAEVFGRLQQHAVPLVDNPNTVLRRLLGLDGVSSVEERNVPLKLNFISQTTNSEAPEVLPNLSTAKARKKQPKVQIQRLVEGGWLKEREVLYLYDYGENRIPGKRFTAKVFNGKLLWQGDGNPYSPSALARELLKERGYVGEDVRGTLHWRNESGSSLVQMWDEYLGKRHRFTQEELEEAKDV